MGSLESVEAQPLTARLAGAASMRHEIELVLDAVQGDPQPGAYRSAIHDENAARKGSSTARMWAWLRLKLRYALDSTDTPEFKAFAAAMRDGDQNARGLTAYLMLARTDRLFREASLALLAPLLGAPGTEVDAAAVLEYVEAERLAAGHDWSAKSVKSVAGHIVTSWKDFGLVEGTKTRKVLRVAPRASTIVFAVRLGRSQGLTDRRCMESDWFRLLGMEFGAVDAALRAAARNGSLRYRSQADVIEIELPETA